MAKGSIPLKVIVKTMSIRIMKSTDPQKTKGENHGIN